MPGGMGVTHPGEPFFKDGTWHWLGGAWRRSAFEWGISEQYAEIEDLQPSGGGTITLNFSVVPAGEIWRITTYCARCDTANPTLLILGAVIGGNMHHFKGYQYTIANLTLDISGSPVLAEGDNLRVIFTNTVAGDNLVAYANGYKMHVNL